MNDDQEHIAAIALLNNARYYAELYDSDDESGAEEQGATVAIIMRALQLLHPGKTNAGLARLLFVDGKDGQQEYDNFISTLSAEQRARLFQGEE